MLGFAGQSGDFLLAPFLFGDIPGDLRRTDDLALGISDRRDGEGDGNQAAVLALTDRLEMVDALAAPDARQNGTLFVLPVLRNDEGDGLANGLFGGIAEDALGARVPARDHAIEVLAHDGIVARLDNGRQPAQALLAVAKLGFDALALANIDSRGIQERDIASPVADGMHGKIHDALAAVRHPIRQLLAEDAPGGSLPGGEANSRLCLSRAAPPGCFPEGPIQNLFRGVPAPRDRKVIHLAQIALEIHDAGEDAGLVEHRPEFSGFGNVAIGFEDGFIAEQLHAAVDNDLAAILAGMA